METLEGYTSSAYTRGGALVPYVVLMDGKATMMLLTRGLPITGWRVGDASGS